MNKNVFSLKNLLIVMVFFSAVWWFVMYKIDQNVPFLSGFITHCISGEIWFQLISNWLLALPSIGICAYALIQTERYHNLEEEHMRPELLMESAELSMCMVNWKGFDQWTHSMDGIGVQQEEKYKQYREKHSKEFDKLGYLDFKSDLFLKGGESITRITIQQVIVQIGNRKYLMRFHDTGDANRDDYKDEACISFRRSYKNGLEGYHIQWQPDYMKIYSEESFWDDMYNAVVDSEYDIVRNEMEWRIFLNIEYGMNKSQCRKKPVGAEWRIRWSGEGREAVNDYTAKRYSQEGILIVG